MATVKAPKHLGKDGKALWASIADSYELRPDELAVLEQACATADTISELEDARLDEGRPLTTTGSMGQQVIHPYIGELRAQRSQLSALLGKLKLPDEAGEAGDAGSAGRALVSARWGKGA